MLFAQSRALHRALRQFYRAELALDSSGNVTAGSTAAPAIAMDDKRTAMIFITELFHRQVFDAFEQNPLSAVLSLAWTICTTCFHISAEMEETEYLRVWSPFICTVNVLCQLNSKLNGDSTSAAAAAVERGGGGGGGGCDGNGSNGGDLFDLDDLRAADRAFVHRIDQNLKLNLQQRQRLTREQTNSRLFISLLERTPFGTYQINDFPDVARLPSSGGGPDDDREWMVAGKVYSYMLSPVNVLDRERFLVLFTRHETNEKLRKQVETVLREKFAAYHSRHELNLSPWMIATHERESDGSRATIWQMQKSALVWILYHCLAALVTVNANQLLINDFVAAVQCMDNFIECGMCLNHWNEFHRKRWDRQQPSSQAVVASLLLSTSRFGRKPSSSLFASAETEPDLALLITHNSVQATIDPRLRLTDAAVYALREDYLNFARATALSLSNKSFGNSVHVPVSTSIHKIEELRQDVCREPWELWSYQLERMLTLQDADKRSREFVKNALLRLEWDRFNQG